MNYRKNADIVGLDRPDETASDVTTAVILGIAIASLLAAWWCS